MIALIATDCASPVADLSGDKYSGEASAPQCETFKFDIAIHEGKVSGYAWSYPRGKVIAWDVTGTVDSQGHLTMRTTTGGEALTSWAAWVGEQTPTEVTIRNSSSRHCPELRKGTLKHI